VRSMADQIAVMFLMCRYVLEATYCRVLYFSPFCFSFAGFTPRGSAGSSAYPQTRTVCDGWIVRITQGRASAFDGLMEWIVASCERWLLLSDTPVALVQLQ